MSRRIDFDSKKVSEAFRAGNRARKKESAADTAEGVDIMEAEIRRFEKETGLKLEVRDGRPYYKGYLSIECSTMPVFLPQNLEVSNSLSLEYSTGLESLPAGLTVHGSLFLSGCRNLKSLPPRLFIDDNLFLTDCVKLTSLPADLSFKNPGNISHIPGSLTSFFRSKAHIYVKAGDDVDTGIWMMRRHHINEAFKAGNRARKKEAAQDTVGTFDGLLITPDKVRDYIGTDILSIDKMCTNISWRELINRLLSEVFEKPHSKVDTYVKHENGISISTYYYTGRESYILVSGNNGYVMRLRVDGEGHPDKFTVGITFYDRGVRCLRDRGGDKEYETVLERDNWHGYEFNDEGLLMFCQFLSTGIVPAGFAVKDVVLDEAFKAGNRARKKEAVQDTVESVNSVQDQIDRFKELTGLMLEIKDGRPYFDGHLPLYSCTRLTSLPTGLKVNGDLNLTGCTGLTKLPDGLKIKGNLHIRRTGLTSLPFDLVVQGKWIIHHGVMTSFFRKLGIRVDRDGDTKASYWRNWQKANGYLTEAFKAGNKARKKEAIQDAATVTDSVNLSFMNTIGEIESFLCRRGEQEDRVMTAEGDAMDSRKWFDWRGRTEDYQALVIEVENIDDDTCNVYVYVDATGVPSTFDATGQHRMDFECARSLSNRTVLNNVLSIFDRLAGPAGEDELPDDLRENDENWEIYKNLIRKHADFLQPFLCKQDLDRLIVDGVLDEAFKAGNRARRKDSVQDTVESADRPVMFDETLGEIERLIHRIGSKYKRNPHNNLYSKQRPEAQAEIFHIHPFSSNELNDNDVSRDGFYPGGWPEKVSHSYDAVVDLAYFPELDRTFVMMCSNVCTVDPGDIRHMNVFGSAGSYSEYYMGDYMDKDPLRDSGDYDLMGSEFFYPVDTVSDLGRILEVVTYMLTDRKWLACMALFTVCRPFSSQYTRSLLPGAICPYIRKDIRISPEMLYSAVNGVLWNELLIKTNGLCGAIIDGLYTYQEILSMFEPVEYRSEPEHPKVLLW